MDALTLETALRARLRGRWLLDHPFYRRWTEGRVSVEELRAYAAQYRHFEAMLPAHLRGVADAAPQDSPLRLQALRNLDDESTHLDLFDGFAAALDAPRDAAPSPAMARLLDTYASASAHGSAAGFAALLAYELQAPDVAASKAGGLREHGVLDGDALRFWDLHATLDHEHARWALDALAAGDDDARTIVDAAGAAADAWWSFLDERESLRA